MVFCIFLIYLLIFQKFCCIIHEVYEKERGMKRTYQPKKKQRSGEHGFLSRMATKAGRKVIAARRTKGRHSLTV